MPQLTQTPLWPDILKHAQGSVSAQDVTPIRLGELSLDYSKQQIDAQGLKLLATCLEQQNFAKQRTALFAGEKVNASEGRAALHMNLRSSDASAEITDALKQCFAFAEKLRAKQMKGATGKIIKNIIHIGIGGSDLGPQLVVHALVDTQCPNIVFIRNVDGAPIVQVMAQLNPEETILFVASKTFTTAETLLNANTLLEWMGAAIGRDKALQHVIALTAAPDKARAYGVREDHIFRFWDWVGGRFSIWSAIGLPAMVAMGADAFTAFLRGAEAMDKHFCDAPLLQNMPVLLAMLSVWNINVRGCTSRVVLPYCEALSEWPSYLQQLEMESLGKSVDRDGRAVDYATAPVVFGMTGTPAQHAFMQAVHQGTQIIPAEIILVKNPAHTLVAHHRMLMANGLAQAEALQRGKQVDDPQKCFSGKRPSTTITLEQLSPFALGQLLALYEHKVFTESVFWNLNPFDQWGVELGKVLAAEKI